VTNIHFASSTTHARNVIIKFGGESSYLNNNIRRIFGARFLAAAADLALFSVCSDEGKKLAAASV